jgi:hypothetical protein
MERTVYLKSRPNGYVNHFVDVKRNSHSCPAASWPVKDPLPFGQGDTRTFFDKKVTPLVSFMRNQVNRFITKVTSIDSLISVSAPPHIFPAPRPPLPAASSSN